MRAAVAAAGLSLCLLVGCQPSDRTQPAAVDPGTETATRPQALPSVGESAASSVPEPPAPRPAASAADAGGPAASGATVGGDGSQILLAPLSAADVEAAALAGELACAFLVEDELLLLARGDVASDAAARGVVKVGDHVEPVAAPGGFDAMLRGARFHGAGKTIDIELVGPAIGGGESPPRPAILTYHRADGARRDFSGRWECGP